MCTRPCRDEHVCTDSRARHVAIGQRARSFPSGPDEAYAYVFASGSGRVGIAGEGKGAGGRRWRAWDNIMVSLVHLSRVNRARVGNATVGAARTRPLCSANLSSLHSRGSLFWIYSPPENTCRRAITGRRVVRARYLHRRRRSRRLSPSATSASTRAIRTLSIYARARGFHGRESLSRMIFAIDIERVIEKW